jgi:hypothetical protein
MSNFTATRRDLGLALLAGAPNLSQIEPESQLGNLYPLIQAMADTSPLELSFLRSEFHDQQHWQRLAREKLFDLLY